MTIQIDLARAKALYEKPMPMREVAAELGVNESTLLGQLKRSGWQPRGMRPGMSLPLEQRDEIQRRTYRGEALGVIAKSMGVKFATVKRYDWPTRRPADYEAHWARARERMAASN